MQVTISSFLPPLKAQVDALEANLSSTGYQVTRNERNPGPQNIIEWALPALITLMITCTVGEFSKGFFNSAGKEAYEKTKSAITKAFGQSKRHTYRWRNVEDRVEPTVNREGPMSPPLRLDFDIGGNYKPLFIFDKTLRSSDFANAFDALEVTFTLFYQNIWWHTKQLESRLRLSQVAQKQPFPYDRPPELETWDKINSVVGGHWHFDPQERFWFNVML